MDTILKIENISKSFGGVEVLHNITLDIRRGEIHSIIGENGAGKSTLMKIIGGIYPANTGIIYKNGREIRLKDPLDAFAHGIGIVHQELSIADNLTVAQNMLAGVEPVNKLGFVDDKKLISQAAHMLKSLGLDIDPSRKAGDLSVGMQQVVEIAKVISKDIDVLIMDEPTSSLSEKEISHLFELLFSLQKQRNITILFISHKLSEIMEISDRATVLRDGTLIGTLPKENLSIPAIINMMIGRALDWTKSIRAKKAPGDVVLSAKKLCRHREFENISFTLHQNEILGLFGLVGAGRTEMACSLMGVNKLDAGEIVYLGRPVRFRTPREAVKNGICYLTENRKEMGLFLTKPLTDNIIASSLEDFTKKSGAIDQNAVRKVCLEYIQSLNIQPPDLNKHLLNFSGGNQQKVLLAKSLAAKPKVLIVDEPTRGVDVGAKSTIHQILRDLAESGLAILMISSELPEILQLSDRVMVMHEGNPKGTLANENLTEKDVMSLAFSKEISNEN